MKLRSLLLFSVLGVALPSLGLAQGVDAGSGVLQGFAQILTIFVNMFTFLSLQLLEFGGQLFGTEWIMGVEALKGVESMHQVVKNMVNLSFVLVLVGLAFTNLFAGISGTGNWTIKEKLPRVVIALIAIQFALPIMKFAISGVHVMSMSIISLSETTLESYGAISTKDILEFRTTDKGDQCYSVGGDCLTFADRMNSYFCQGGSGSSTCWFEVDIDKAGQGTAASSEANNLFLAFGVYFQQLQRLPALSANLGGWTGWVEVSQDALFSMIMSIVYVVSLVAIFIALLARVIVLWVALVASPALIAAAILGIGGGDSASDTVVTHLIMPIKIALALTVSFVMMSGMSDMMLSASEASFIQVGSGAFSLGSYGFIWQILTVVVFWKAAFWAVEGSMAEDIINTVKSGAEGLGTMALQGAVLDRQLFSMKDPNDPTKELGLSLRALEQLPSDMKADYERKTRLDRDENIAKILGTDESSQDIQNAVTEMETRKSGFKSEKDALDTGVTEMNRMGTRNLNTTQGKRWRASYLKNIETATGMTDARRDQIKVAFNDYVGTTKTIRPDDIKRFYDKVSTGTGYDDVSFSEAPKTGVTVDSTATTAASTVQLVGRFSDTTDGLEKVTWKVNGGEETIDMRTEPQVNRFIDSFTDEAEKQAAIDTMKAKGFTAQFAKEMNDGSTAADWGFDDQNVFGKVVAPTPAPPATPTNPAGS